MFAALSVVIAGSVPAAATNTASYDPLAYSRQIGNWLENRDAEVPPQCYTRTGASSNPCWTCHTSANGRNQFNDWDLQKKYEFASAALTNHWTNLFKDRRADIAKISDAQLLDYIRRDNYRALRAALRDRQDYIGWRPDLDLVRGFDAQGFAEDGSAWRAFRFKPFPGTFWPTNGSTDDVMIRLPARFRHDAQGRPSLAVYKANLAIVEAVVGVPDTVPDQKLRRTIEPVDEQAADFDLDGDGRVAGTVSELRSLPSHYVGGAVGDPVIRYDYPVGTEFLHTVRYIDPDAPDRMSTRLKELRYAVKRYRLDSRAAAAVYAEEDRETKAGAPSSYGGNAASGQINGFGWQLQGFIEDAAGRLRLQTREEQLYCMGCHSGVGVTVDSTFSLPRKVPGLSGWGHQNLAGMADVPQAGTHEPETLRYFSRVGGGDEFRANDEMLRRFFPGGHLDRARVRAQAGDLPSLIFPSRERALELGKAYLLIVAEQSYVRGRDAVISPAANVHQQLANTETELKASDRIYRDGRLWLDWDGQAPDAMPGPRRAVGLPSHDGLRQ
jgi:hypothetical protein